MLLICSYACHVKLFYMRQTRFIWGTQHQNRYFCNTGQISNYRSQRPTNDIKHNFTKCTQTFFFSFFLSFFLYWSFGAFSPQFAVGILLCKNDDHPWLFHCNTFAGSLSRYLNTRPSGLVFKQLPRDPANVNAWKTMGDPYIESDVKPA